MKLHTKQDFVSLCADIINPLKDKYSEKCAYMSAGAAGAWYEDVSTYVEGFSRPLWGLVPLWAGGNDIKDFSDIYIKGITAGVDPNSGEYWGVCHRADQRFVEMAAMAYGIIFTPEKIWEPLSENTKVQFAAWLGQINDNFVCDSNWLFFRVLVNIALKKVNMPYSKECLSADLNRLDDFYVGEGWYMDGVQQQKDYYIPFAIQFYSLIYATAMGREDPERCARFKQRAFEFGRQFIYWFADDGEALPYGRSLTYRFAQLSFWSACLMTDVRPFETGVIKGIITRGLEEWFKNDDIFDNGHILSVGYKYPTLIPAEHYNSPSSPYWSMKTFALLMLPDDHEFWSCEALPMPKLDAIKPMKCADMIVQRIDGEVYAYPAGTHNNLGCGQIVSKYLKFAYSTLFGFNAMRSQMSLEECAPDNMLVFVVDGMVFVRRHNYSYSISDDCITSRWSPIKGITVKTTVIPTAQGHNRIHHINSEIECIVYECGYAAANRDEDKLVCTGENNICRMDNAFSYSEVKVSEAQNAAVEGIKHIIASPNVNLFYRKAALPAVRIRIGKGTSEIHSVISAGKIL